MLPVPTIVDFYFPYGNLNWRKIDCFCPAIERICLNLLKSHFHSIQTKLWNIFFRRATENTQNHSQGPEKSAKFKEKSKNATKLAWKGSMWPHISLEVIKIDKFAWKWHWKSLSRVELPGSFVKYSIHVKVGPKDVNRSQKKAKIALDSMRSAKTPQNRGGRATNAWNFAWDPLKSKKTHKIGLGKVKGVLKYHWKPLKLFNLPRNGLGIL